MSRARPLVVALLLGLVATLGGATPARAGDTVLGGTLYGEDGRAVSALLGFDLRDGQGRTLGASGCVRSSSCPVEGYAMTRRVNFDLGAEGGPASQWDTDWAVTLPEEAERVYVEVYPQGRRYAGTDLRRYAASFRRNLRLPYDTDVNLRLPLVCGVRGDRGTVGGTGFVNGYARESDDGRRVPLKRITAFSLEPDNNRPSPVLGFGGGLVASNGYYRVPHLASGSDGAAQRYQLIATALDGRVRRVYDVAIGDCGRVARNIDF